VPIFSLLYQERKNKDGVNAAATYNSKVKDKGSEQQHY
jgi:hypothetical protein